MEQMLQSQDSTAASSGVGRHEHSTPRGSLQICDVMSKEVATASPHDPIALAARRMSEHNVSCLVVLDDGQVVGILTEKDVLKGVAGRDIEFHRLRVSQRMSSPVRSIPPNRSVLEASRIMNTADIRRMPVVQDGQLLGIVTETDITRGLVSLNPVQSISDIMTPHVATVDANAMVDEAARIMASQSVPCVIARHRQEAAGIVSEKDVLRRVVALHKDPTRTPIAEIMSVPVVAVPPTYSILSASRKMESMHLHRLIVMDKTKIYGIVTQSDILRTIRSAFELVEAQRREMAAQFAELVRSAIHDMQQAEEFLRRIQNSGATSTDTMTEQATGPAEMAAYCIL